MQEEVKHYKVKSLPTSLRPNSVYYVKATSQGSVKTYITDQGGFPYPLIDLASLSLLGIVNSVTGTGVTGTGSNPIINISTFKSSDLGNLIEISSNDGKLFVKPITSPDGSIDINSTSTSLELQLGASLQTQIQNALQSGDNISELTNDAGYITLTDIPTKTSDLTNDGSDNTSTYVETDELGNVAFSNDYNDLDNLPTIPGAQNLQQVLAIGGREVKGVGEIYTFVEEDKTKILVDALGEESYVLNANIFVDGDSIIIDRTARATEIPLTLASEVIIDNSSIFESINLQPNAVAIITRIGGNDGVSEIFSLTYQTSRISNRLTKVINDVSPYTIIVDDINKLLVIESEEDIVINDDIVELNNEFHLKNISGSERELLYDGTINFEGNSIIENQGYCILKCIDTTTNTWSVNTIIKNQNFQQVLENGGSAIIPQIGNPDRIYGVAMPYQDDNGNFTAFEYVQEFNQSAQRNIELSLIVDQVQKTNTIDDIEKNIQSISSVNLDTIVEGEYTTFEVVNVQESNLLTNEVVLSQYAIKKPIPKSGTVVNIKFPYKEVSGDYDLATTDDIPSVGDFVPYTGANANVDLGEYELKAGQIELDTTPTGTAGVAVTRWNDTIGSSETTLKGGNVILKNGVDLVARIVNKVTPNTTLTKASYQAVRISGAQGQRLAVNLAQANNDNNSADTLGIVTETIATNQEGFIMTVGQLENINTTGNLQGETWNDGDVLYLSPTTAGRLTNVKPSAPGHIVVMGYVEYAHQNNGKIYVKIMNGWELDELHNVSINAPLNNQVLTYESATDLWKNRTIIQDTITDGVTTIAPSQNAVFDALNLKIDKPQILKNPSNYNLINTTSFQKITANVGINGDGSFNVQAGKIYNIRGAYRMVGIGGGSYSFGAITDGIATFSDIQLESLAVKSTSPGNPLAMNGLTITSFSSTTPNHNTSAGAGGYQRIDGDFTCLTSGKMFPAVSISVSHNGIVSLCNFVLTPLN
jgi:nitrogen fixation protein